MSIPAPPALGRIRAGVQRRAELATAVFLLVVGVFCWAIGLTGMWTPTIIPNASSGWQLLLVIVASALVFVKRWRPGAAVLGGVVVFAVDFLLGGSVGVLLVFIDLLYTAALAGSKRLRRILLVSTVATIALTVVATAVVTASLRETVFLGLQAFALFATPYWWAASVRQKSELAELESARADDAQRLGALRESNIVVRERARMARDLHDVIASHLSAVAIHAEAALSAPPDTERDRAALASIRVSSVASLDEMRAMIVLLRSGEDTTATIGGLDRLDDFVATARAAGSTITVDADAFAALPALPAATEQAATRILQEAVTNAMRHAPGSTIDIRATKTAWSLVLEIESVGAASPSSSGSGGFGLRSMTERAEALGGALHAGWQSGAEATWLVHAELPLEAS